MSIAPAVCQTCLASDRKLVPVLNVQKTLLEVHFSDLVGNCGGVCWECNRMLLKFSTFKSQVTYVQRLLRTSNKATKFQSLSQLKHVTRKAYDLIRTEPEDPLTYDEKAICEPLVIINEETRNQEHQHDNNEADDSDWQDISDQIEPNGCKSDRVESNNKNKVKKRGNLSASSDSRKSGEEESVKTKKSFKKRRKSSAESNDSVSDAEIDRDLKEKYEIVEFTEEELLRNREEKRNGHNYKKIPYKCDLCVLGFTRKETYDHHLIRKHDKKIGKHSCPVCTVYFPTLKALQHHQTKHYTLYKCRLCKYEATELCSIENHCRVKHKKDKADRIHCQTCSAVCKSPEEMAAHARAQHPLQCAQCREVFKGKNTLRAHIRRIHEAKREFTCGVCGRSCASRSRLESHAASHGGAQARRLAYCALCRVQYKTIHVYRNHRHNSPAHAQTAHECPVCHKKFASKVYLKRHNEFFHQKKSKFKCQDCNKLFMSAWSQRQHRQLHHGEVRPRNYPCDLCTKKFFTSSTLKNHRLTHSSERRYMCAQCGDTFKQRPSLYTHARLVHQARPVKTSTATIGSR